MANPTGIGGIKPGERRNPSGLSREEHAERERVRALLLTPTRDAKWLEAYDAALESGVAPIIIDYAYRRLGKPKDSLEVSGDDIQELLLTLLARMQPQQLTAHIDSLKDEQ